MSTHIPESYQPGFEFLLNLWGPWASYLNFTNLGFLICKMRTTREPLTEVKGLMRR